MISVTFVGLLCIAWIYFTWLNPQTRELLTAQQFMVGSLIVTVTDVVLLLKSRPKKKKATKGYTAVPGGAFACPNCGAIHRNVQRGQVRQCECGLRIEFGL